MLNQWGWSKQSMWVDDGPGVLWLGEEIVLTATVCEEMLNVDYGKDWELYMQSEPWNKMINDTKGKITKKASKGESKGKGKQKGHGKKGGSY